MYYIRQVGDCVWWFGTEVRTSNSVATGQRGFANVASGRIDGTEVDLEWADVPLGDTVNGGVARISSGVAAVTSRRGS